MNVLMISPGFPREMAYFTRGLAAVGAHVIGLGDQQEGQLPEEARKALSAHLHVPSFRDEGAIVEQVADFASRVPIHRVECLWEPYVLLAARIRERLGLPGLTVQQTIPFRDKEVMKRVLDAAGVRTPHHYSATTVAQVVEGAEAVGYPVIVKPIAGAGSESTYKVHNRQELDAILPGLRHVTEVSVEEFVDGEDMTFDTLCVDGEVKHYSASTYIPRALYMKENEWVSPITLVLRDPDAPDLAEGKKMGFQVLKALGFQTGYTHMEWYRTPAGEAVFGEIGARSPGAGLVDLINYAADIDTYTGWAECVVHGRFTQRVERKYNAAWIYKRAQGQGRIQRYEGLEAILTEFGPHIVDIDLNPIGAPRRDWRKVLVGDGLVVVRHPDLATTRAMAERVAARLHIVAE
ncbi:MAG TPA: ATP-grasp domain-containing protein [Longimicrobiales bacterium]|nr:ATP-grasp domain-containing protein [Longimicrobiales bacterium]